MKIDTKIDIRNGTLTCKCGRVDFAIEDAEMSIFQIFICNNHRRKGIGLSLVKKLEEFASRIGLRRIVVPVSPSRQALSFWKKIGYSYVFPEDRDLEGKVLADGNPQRIESTGSGVIVHKKVIKDINRYFGAV